MFPKTWLNLVLAFLFATLFGVGAAVLSDVLDNTIRDPDQVARLLNTDVIGSLPAVKDWRRRLSPIQSMSMLNGTNGHGMGRTAMERMGTRTAVRATGRMENRAPGQARRIRAGAIELRRSDPHAAQFDPADGFRPATEERAADQRVAIGRQVDGGRASGRDACQPAQAHTADRR